MQKNKRGRKSKLTPDVESVIIATIESTGTDKVAYESAGIGHDLFYRTLRENKEFSERIKRAREVYRKNRSQGEIDAAQQRILDYLHNVAEDVVVTELEKEFTLPNGMIGYEKSREVKTFRKACPANILALVLGTETELTALKRLVDAGWVPRSVLETAQKGINNLKSAIQDSFLKN